MKRIGERKVRFPVFVDRFRELQGKRSNTEFAELLGISRQTVGFYCNGDRIPDALGVRDIAEKCGVSADWLLGLSDVRSMDVKLNQVCKYIGLSEDAVQKIISIHAVKTDVVSTETALNILLSSETFGAGVYEFQKMLAFIKQSIIEEENGTYFDGDLDELGERELLQFIEKKVGKPVQLLIGYDQLANYHMSVAKYCFSNMVELEMSFFEYEVKKSLKTTTNKNRPRR